MNKVHPTEKDIHMMSIKEIEKMLNVDITKGLDSAEAQNLLAKKEVISGKLSYFNIYQEIINGLVDVFSLILWANLIIYIVLSIFFNTYPSTAFSTDLINIGIIMTCLVIKSSVIGLQEYKSMKLMKKLQTKNKTRVKVMRDGVWGKIAACELVVGDAVEINANEHVPVDLRLFFIDNLSFDKSILTGEVEPIEAELNEFENMESKTSYIDARNMAFSNFVVVSGYGRGVVVSDESHSYNIKRLTNKIGNSNKRSNLIRKGLDLLGITIILLLVVSILIYIIVWATSLRLKFGLSTLDLLSNCLNFAVTGIPIGLPVTLTIGIFIVIQKLRKYDIVIKNLFAIHSTSDIDVVLTDKTGTLTYNSARVASVLYSTTEIDVDLCVQTDEVYLGAQPGLNELLDLCDFCSSRDSSQNANVIEQVLFDFAHKNRPKVNRLSEEYKLLKEIAFTSSNKYQVRLIKTRHDKSVDQKEAILMIRGAPEFLLRKCKYLMNETGKMIEMDTKSVRIIMSKIEKWSSMSRRLICFCEAKIPHSILDKLEQMHTHEFQQWFDSECNNCMFVGMIGFIDPPKPCSKESVQRIREIGIRIVMVTGDYSITAAAIGKEVGILSDMKYDTFSTFRQNRLKINSRKVGIVLNGSEMDKLTKEEWSSVCNEYTEIILSRATPNHKLLCVKQFQSNGHSVLMVGDGVNDVAAMKQAELSVAMSAGSKLASDVASVVLLNNYFESVYELISFGRQTLINIKKIFLISIISSVFCQIVPTLLTITLGIPILFSDLQMTIISGFIEVIISVSLFFDKPEVNQVKTLKDHIIDHRLLIMGLCFFAPLSLSFTYLNYFIYFKFYDSNSTDLIFKYFSENDSSDIILVAQSICFYTIIVIQTFGNLYSIRSRRVRFIHSLPFIKSHQNWVAIAASFFVWILATLLVSFSIPNFTKPIPPVFYPIPFAYAILILVINHLRKMLISRFTFLQPYFSW